MLGQRLGRSRGLPLRSRLRAALPSSVVGLVSFSFATLAFGTTVYLTALPSLIATSPVVSQVVDAASNASDAAGKDGGTDSTAEGDASSTTGDTGGSLEDAASDIDTEDDGGATSTAETISGVAGLNALADTSTAEADSSDNAQDEGEKDESKGAKATDRETSEQSESSGTSEEKQEETQSQQEEQTEQAEAEADREAHDYLVGKLEHANELAEKLSQLNTEASQNFLADHATREASKLQADAFVITTQNAFATMVNTRTDVSQTKYGSDRGNLIAMYRCLWQAASVLQQGWTSNVGYADATASKSKLSDLYHSMAQTENDLIAEYNERAKQLSL